MTGGGHLEFSHEKVDEKNGVRVNISQQEQLLQHTQTRGGEPSNRVSRWRPRHFRRQ